ncbi:hypothetical protein ACH5AI_02545 [Streptomyces collinus]|uniref:hypothetical protein n=1 Tax=Streptomyces collinus TaxID=42684 RepID=UPI0037BAC1FA
MLWGARVELKRRTVRDLAEMICGNGTTDEENYFEYRSSMYLTEFFQDVETDFQHDGTTRAIWVYEVLTEILKEPRSGANSIPDTFARVIARLMDRADARNEGPSRPKALEKLNASLSRDGYQAFYGEDGQCYLRHIATNAVSAHRVNPHRPLSPDERRRREQLASFLNAASEDEIIERVLLPLFRQLGYQRITSAGHKDKALEYGKDIWMKYVLPTQHVLYFGVQVKRDKLDAAGYPKRGNANVAEILNQTLMMLDHPIFDPELNKQVLVDHAYIVAGGEITKQARGWIGERLDATRRRQLIFMDRNDLMDLFVVTKLPTPGAETGAPSGRAASPWPSDPPF